MKQNRKHKRRHHPNRIEKSLVVCGDVKDPVAARAASEVDALDDYEWLEEHPDVEERRRPVTLREVMAYGLPFGSEVVVARGPGNTLAQMIFPPKK